MNLRFSSGWHSLLDGHNPPQSMSSAKEGTLWASCIDVFPGILLMYFIITIISLTSSLYIYGKEEKS